MAYLDEVDLAAKSAEAKQSAARPARTKKQAAKATTLGDVESLPTSAPPLSPHRASRNATPEVILGVSSHETTYAEENDADEIECENTQEDLPSRRRNLALPFNDVNNESSASDGAFIESGSEGNGPAGGGLDGTVEATQG
ncbi:hypothetical protein PInf_016765 [Phytophthora infestans]|nr:hypothetical protein PInf_016765 [Phytophthora infestans]